MKYKNLIFLAIGACSLSALALVATNNISLSAYNPSLTWWENNCEMPEGYTSIKDIFEDGVKNNVYTTRGTVTAVESSDFFIQSQGYALEIYTAPGTFEVGNVIDVTGTFDIYRGTPELKDISFSTLVAKTNPYPVEAYEVDAESVGSCFSHINGLVEIKDIQISSVTSSKLMLKCGDSTFEGYVANSKIKTAFLNSLVTAFAATPNDYYTFTGIIGTYNSSPQVRIWDESQLVYDGSGEEILPTSISISPKTLTLYPTASPKQFSASFTPSKCSNRGVTWSCSGGSITSSGLFTHDGIGAYTITATSTANPLLSDTATVEVIEKEPRGGEGVVKYPTLNKNTLGPLYFPNVGDEISISYLEMSSMYGDSILFDYGNFEMLIDGGAREDKDTVMAALEDKVEDGQIEVMINTHPHVDHFGGLSYKDAYAEAGITDIKYLIDCGGTYSTTNYADWDETRQFFIENGTIRYTIYEMMQNQNGFPNTLKITNDITLMFLQTDNYVPAGVKISDANTASIASLLIIGDTRYFLTGDITNEEGAGPEHKILTYYQNMGLWGDDTINVVKANHHCSNTHGSNSSEWAQGTEPDYVIVSAAMLEDNRTSAGVIYSQHPHDESIGRYNLMTDNIFWNGINGTITFNHETSTSDPVMSFAGRSFDYYDKRDGSMVSREMERSITYLESVFYQTRKAYKG